MKRTLYLSLFAGFFIVLTSSQKLKVGEFGSIDDSAFTKILADLEKDLMKDIEKDNTGSISALVIRGDRVVWSRAAGKSNNEKDILADSTTVYRIGSISKTIAAYLMMRMVQDGMIQLDDPVAKFLPEIKQLKADGKNKGEDITFRQLASHTSGLENEPDNTDNTALGRTEDWENMMLGFIPTTSFRYQIGERYWYSNAGYGILGLALSRAAHKPFLDLVNEMVFQPHGMKNSFYIIPPGSENRIASGYHWSASSETYTTEFADKQFIGRSYKVPPGGVFTTAHDLARFAMALTADSDVLAKKYRDTMQMVQPSTSKGNNEGYGLGLFIYGDKKGVDKIGHTGMIAGYKAYMFVDPVTRVGLVLMRNSDKPSVNLERMGNILLTKLVKAAD